MTIGAGGRAAALAIAMIATAAPAHARELCAERPGLGMPACTVEPGAIQIETGLADRTRDRDDGERVDTLTIGATEVRLGIAESSEVQLMWTPWGRERRHMADGAVARTAGVGDLRLAFKRNLANPDGEGLSFAILPFATLPVGRSPIGAGAWAAGLVAPVTYDLTDAIQLEFTPEVDAAADEDGAGRHLAYSGVAGVEFDVTDAVEVTAELQGLRDRDPDGHKTWWLGGLALAFQPSSRVQLDVGAAAGLDADAPPLRIYAGVATRF